jgi:hypothetical protein
MAVCVDRSIADAAKARNFVVALTPRPSHSQFIDTKHFGKSRLSQPPHIATTNSASNRLHLTIDCAHLQAPNTTPKRGGQGRTHLDIKPPFRARAPPDP